MDGSRKKGYFPKEKEGKKLNIREDGTLSGGALDAKTGKVSGLVDFDPEDVVSAAYAEKLENENLQKNEKIKNLERQNARKQAQINKYQNSEQTQLRNQVYLNGTFDIIAKNCPKKLVKSKLHGQFLCAHNNYFSAS